MSFESSDNLFCSKDFAIQYLDDCFMPGGCEEINQEMCLSNKRCVPGEIRSMVRETVVKFEGDING